MKRINENINESNAYHNGKPKKTGNIIGNRNYTERVRQ